MFTAIRARLADGRSFSSADSAASEYLHVAFLSFVAIEAWQARGRWGRCSARRQWCAADRAMRRDGQRLGWRKAAAFEGLVQQALRLAEHFGVDDVCGPHAVAIVEASLFARVDH